MLKRSNTKVERLVQYENRGENNEKKGKLPPCGSSPVVTRIRIKCKDRSIRVDKNSEENGVYKPLNLTQEILLYNFRIEGHGYFY